MDPHTAAVLNALGGDADGFRARHYTRELAEAADLVFTMTRSQRHSVLKTTPRGLRRTFTLTEAARLLDHADLTGLPLLPLTERARQLGLRLDAARAWRSSAISDDIDDPAGRPPAVHREVADRIASALRPLADVLFASVRTQLSAPERVEPHYP